MKNILMILFLMFTLFTFSCKKETQIETFTASYEFKLKDKDYKWNFQPDSSNLERGARLKKAHSPNKGTPIYVLDGWSYPEEIRVELVLDTDVLSLGTFTTTIPQSYKFIESFCQIYGIQYGSITGDYTSVKITKISGKYVSGSFSAVMHDITSSTSEIRIYNGYFNNIIIQE